MYNVNVEKLPSEPYKPLATLCRKAAAEGVVLLKNEGNILPVSDKEVISLFGRTQIDYNKSGTGSGGLVRVEYSINILDGIRNNPKLNLNEELVRIYQDWIEEHPFDKGKGWAQEPWCQKEMVPDESLVIKAREKSDVAVIVIGRAAGEDKDNSAQKGSWFLNDEEEALLKLVTKYFEKTVVLLNVGNIIDMNWVEKYDIKSVMYIWQGGQEGGNAVADLLCGDVTPCGKLADTIARDISLYPGIENFGNPDYNLYVEDIYVGYRYFETFKKEDVLYPFGFGLSYTEFDYNLVKAEEKDGIIRVELEIKNIGKYSGREIAQVYFEAPQGVLGKSARELCAFKKSKLLSPGESEILAFEVIVNNLCAYDDSGITGNKSCYVLESGEYNIYAGKCVRTAEKVYTHNVKELMVIKRCTEVLAPVRNFDVMHPVLKDGKYELTYKPVSKRTVDYRERIEKELPKEIEQCKDKGIKLVDVKNGKNTMEEFVSQLSDCDLMCLLRGEGMCSPKVRPGGQGATGGITESLSSFGIPVATFHDGPSGIRIDSGEEATSIPNGTLIACTWDVEIAEELYAMVSIELCTHNIDSILGPGINIHRVPLNGRNFEYLSEDPYISGKIGAALVRGVEGYNNSATVKHFAANSQEYRRQFVDSVVSERALREIYLKSFELAINEGCTTSVMTSYNPINGIMSLENYELNTVVLRQEWGYKGFVMTDWWPRLSETGTDINYKNLKNMVEAQNDVYMVTEDALNNSDNLEELLDSGKISRGQLQRNAVNVLNYLMDSRAFERFVRNGGKLEKSLVEILDKLATVNCITRPENSREYAVTVENPGRYLLEIEYLSDAPKISQMIMSIKINGKNATTITVNGTSGEKKTIYRDVSIAHKDIELSFSYPDKLLMINKCVVLKELL